MVFNFLSDYESSFFFCKFLFDVFFNQLSDVSYTVNKKVEYLTFFLVGPVFFQFLSYIFEDYFKNLSPQMVLEIFDIFLHYSPFYACLYLYAFLQNSFKLFYYWLQFFFLFK